MKKDVYDLTNPQKSIWLTEQVYKGTTVNNICTSGTIYGFIDEALLKNAIYNVVKQNDSFRIHICLINGTVKQYISEFKNFEIETQYINNESELQELKYQQAINKFDILDSDLFKFKIIILRDKFACVILTASHIISDSWSMGITIQEILKNYNALKDNQTINIEKPSYINYINFENDYKKSIKFENDKKYWNSVFTSIPEHASIPSSLSSSAPSSKKAKRISFTIEKNISSRINDFCKHNHVSIFNFFMAIYSLYISHVSNTHDFVIGTPILNRTSYRDKHTTGMFVNTVPIRINNVYNGTFASLASSLSKQMREILRHQKYSYNSILEDIRQSHKNIPNLYNIMISYQVTKAFNKQFGNYTTDWIFNGSCVNDMDIHIYDINDTGKLIISYDFLINKYVLKDIENMHSRIVNMISQVLNNNYIHTSNIEIMTDIEKENKIYLFNNTSTEYPKNKTIIDLFEAQVEKTPYNVALTYREKNLTYKNLNERVNQFANFLKENGVKENDRISILLHKNISLIVSILAVLKLGACYIPISPEYPEDRIQKIIEDSNSKLLITSKNNKEKLKNSICVEDLTNLSRFSKSNLNIHAKPYQLAYIIYTSGSTGNPKGVSIAHSSLLNYIYWANKYYCNNKPSNFPLYSSIGFDLTVTSVFTPLICGGSVIIYKENDIFLTLKDIFKNSQADIVKLTPAHLSLINKFKFSNTNVKKLILGGDLLFPDVCKKIVDKFNNITIYNEYGPTEATVGCMIYKYSNSSHKYSSVPIGKPIDNTQIYILDNNLNPVPNYTYGELYISGDGLSRGYINNISLTNKSFLPNPFISNSLIYKTGDIAMFSSNNEIVCLGRSDNQVKIRGLRIELGEIENKINELPYINSCVVVNKGDLSLKSYLCAYFTANDTVNITKIKEHLEKFLPKYMIPSFFIQLKTLPYTNNGKIDKKNLPSPSFNDSNRKVVLPRNNIDSTLIRILQSLLNVNTISIEDDFFDIGGDSLSAINLCIQINDNLDIQLLVNDVFEHPVIKNLSDYISSISVKTKSSFITPVSESDFYEASSAQKRIYYASKLSEKNSILYNTPGGIIIDGFLDKKNLENSINQLIIRHESLRTYFDLTNKKTLVQKIEKNINFSIDVLENADYSNLNTLYKSFVRPFDLTKAPLFRIKLIYFKNNKCALFIDMHHIISDGKSLNIFIDELCKLYNGYPLTKLDITYKDFSFFENNRLRSGALKKAEEYWLKQFEDEVPVLNMPTNYPRPAIQNFEGKKVYSLIDCSTSKKIIELSKKLDITPYMFLLACYYILLSKYSSQDDITVGSPIIGRELEETNNIIGAFINTLALRNKINIKNTFKDFVLQIKDNLLNAYKYREYPFDELMTKLNIKRDTSRNPLFDTMFIFQNRGYAEITLNNVKTKYYIPDTQISKFDLSLEAIPIDNIIKLNFEYATSLFDEQFIKRLSKHYLNIINCVLANINILLSDIDMISKKEKEKILEEFNNTSTDFPKDKTVIELFENQVKQTPNAIAVEDYNGKQLTFSEFNKKSNQLARLLRKKGVGRNDLICIITHRSLDMMIGIWGIIKAGAAYVPIDPNYPEDRKNFILKDSSPKVILLADTDIETTISKIDLTKKEYESEDDTNLNIINTPEDAIYCIYTSGTTGKPKGVINKHIGLINRIMWMNSKYPIKEGDVILQKTTYCFDVSVWEIVWWSFVGAKVSLLKVNGEKNPKDIINAIEKNKITTMHFVPSMLNMFLVYIENLEDLGGKLDTLKYVFTSGEELKKKQVEIFNKKIQSTNKTVKLINVYGPTEASIDVTYYECKGDNKLIPIGKPISNIQVYILDGIKLCGIGIPGEICIGGIGVAKGYLNREDLNKEKFIDNPYSIGKLYRTGDIGRWLPDGNIEYMGRIDHQIKIRGQRIELDEIENLILKYPHIKNTVVMKQTIQNRDCISSYFVADKRININDLRKFLSNSLPNYMIPTYFIPMDNLPFNSNGKLDRKSLPLPTEVLNISKDEYVAPKTKLQKELVNIWEKILNTKPIGINDNFFGLGGDSLLAMNLNIELLKISNKVSYSDIFRYPTVAELEEKINSNSDTPLFSKIESLSDNYYDILKNSKKFERHNNWHPRNVLITGATGFLGAHVLDKLLKNRNRNVYCIVRSDPGISPEKKLKQKLNYYFGNKYDKLINKKIFVIEGDITKPNFGLNENDLFKISSYVDVIINCAAIVSHYGDYKKFYNINVKSVKYMIDFCNTFNIKFYHISTISVTGFNLDSSYLALNKKQWLKKNNNNDIIFDESCQYIGQIIDNVYARSKFEAESYILDAISRGLDGYILRMGHLMPRIRDGVFQENILDNDLINKIISFIKIGAIPDYLLKYPLEFTPVDEAAYAICKLIKHSTYSNRIFHLYNHNSVYVKRLLRELKRFNYDIKVLPEDAFVKKVNSILNDENKKNMLKNVLVDFDSNLHLRYENDINLKSSFTIKYLARCYFIWPKISDKYLFRLIKLLKEEI